MKSFAQPINAVRAGSIFLFLSLAITIASLFLLKAKLSAHHQRILEYVHALIPAERMKSAMQGYVASERGFLLTGQSDFLERLRMADDDFQKHLNELGGWVRTPKGDRLLADILAAEKEHQGVVDKIHALRRVNGLNEDLIRTFENEVFPRRVKLQNLVDSLVQHKEQELLRAEEESKLANDREVTAIILSAGFSILLLSLLALFFSRKLVLLYAESKESEKHIRGLATELSRSNAELERFASIASHDLRSPLNTISSVGNLLEERIKELGDDRAKEYLAFMVDGAAKMRELVDDLLDYARVSNEGTKTERVNLGNVIDDVQTALRKEIEESGAQIVCTELPDVVGDRSQLRQLFSNLVGNAINYRSKDKPLIRISASEEGENWRICVSDNGIGVEMEYADKIFLPFKRLHSYQERPGTGLGLPICRSVVERHGGRIWIKSEVGKGTRFFITFPKIHDQNAKALKEFIGDRISPKRSARSASKPRVI